MIIRKSYINQVILLILMVWSFQTTFGQEERISVTGQVSFVTSQNIYVKFLSTEGINPGDTLFQIQANQRTPVMIVESKSSISIVGKPLSERKTELNTSLTAFISVSGQSETIKEEQLISREEIPVNDQILEESQQKKTIVTRQQELRGRLALSSFSTFSNSDLDPVQRFRYTLSLGGQHIADSRLSAESYISFSHRLGQWSEVKENVFNALKIYSLSASYELTNHTTVWVGRKINPKTSSIGAVDGVQSEINWKNFYFGAVVGSRPDYRDYSLNFSLFEYGGYFAHQFSNHNGRGQSSLAFFNQTNKGATDRRFIYLQHDNSLIKDLFLFTSCEVDLYRIDGDIITTSPSLTSLYLSLRYRINRKLSAFVSYDARKNVVYFETYKSYIDQLLDDAMRQGLQVRLNYKPWNYVTMGVNGGYRYREGDLRATNNINGFISFTKIPLINSALTLSANLLQTGYLDGKIFGIRIYKDFLKGKINGMLNYRLIDYKYISSGSTLLQNNAEVSLGWQFSKKTSLSFDYEISFDKTNLNHRIYLNFVTRL